MSALSGELALKCGRLLAVANAFLISAKHIDFTAEVHEVTNYEQSSLNGAQLANNTG